MSHCTVATNYCSWHCQLPAAAGFASTCQTVTKLYQTSTITAQPQVRQQGQALPCCTPMLPYHPTFLPSSRGRHLAQDSRCVLNAWYTLHIVGLWGPSRPLVFTVCRMIRYIKLVTFFSHIVVLQHHDGTWILCSQGTIQTGHHQCLSVTLTLTLYQWHGMQASKASEQFVALLGPAWRHHALRTYQYRTFQYINAHPENTVAKATTAPD